jgi:ubiquinol oxidase
MLAEAENERMHLMFFVEIAKPNWFERLLVLIAQIIFFVFYFFIYVVSYRLAHKMIAYFEEEAVRSYTDYLAMVESGAVENVPAPQLAIDYYGMKSSAKLSDLIVKVRADEQHHSIINHKYADRT